MHTRGHLDPIEQTGRPGHTAKRALTMLAALSLGGALVLASCGASKGVGGGGSLNPERSGSGTGPGRPTPSPTPSLGGPGGPGGPGGQGGQGGQDGETLTLDSFTLSAERSVFPSDVPPLPDETQRTRCEAAYAQALGQGAPAAGGIAANPNTNPNTNPFMAARGKASWSEALGALAGEDILWAPDVGEGQSGLVLTGVRTLEAKVRIQGGARKAAENWSH
jgi:hypothetical protein